MDPPENGGEGRILFDHLAEDVLARDRPESAAVGAVVAIVAQDEEFVIADANELALVLFIGIGWGIGPKISYLFAGSWDGNVAARYWTREAICMSESGPPSVVENAGMSEPALPCATQVCQKSTLVEVLMSCKSGTMLARVLDSWQMAQTVS